MDVLGILTKVDFNVIIKKFRTISQYYQSVATSSATSELHRSRNRNCRKLFFGVLRTTFICSHSYWRTSFIHERIRKKFLYEGKGNVDFFLIGLFIYLLEHQHRMYGKCRSMTKKVGVFRSRRRSTENFYTGVGVGIGMKNRDSADHYRQLWSMNYSAFFIESVVYFSLEFKNI